jgi:hypothetical protein
MAGGAFAHPASPGAANGKKPAIASSPCRSAVAALRRSASNRWRRAAAARQGGELSAKMRTQKISLFQQIRLASDMTRYVSTFH